MAIRKLTLYFYYINIFCIFKIYNLILDIYWKIDGRLLLICKKTSKKSQAETYRVPAQLFFKLR
jgi:hypothetical protein